jgi:hypothetical protein
MVNTPMIPVKVTPEAAERVAELGMQRELEQMLAHALRTLPGLRSLEVQLELPYDTGDETRITIEATRDKPNSIPDPAWQPWHDWVVSAFPPDVWSMIGLMSVYGPSS